MAESRTGMPIQSTVEERVARSLTDEALAHRLDLLRESTRNFPRAERLAFLEEAARRLRWGRLSEERGATL